MISSDSRDGGNMGIIVDCMGDPVFQAQTKENVPSWKSVQSPECLEQSRGEVSRDGPDRQDLLFRKLCGGV